MNKEEAKKEERAWHEAAAQKGARRPRRDAQGNAHKSINKLRRLPPWSACESNGRMMVMMMAPPSPLLVWLTRSRPPQGFRRQCRRRAAAASAARPAAVATRGGVRARL